MAAGSENPHYVIQSYPSLKSLRYFNQGKWLLSPTSENMLLQRNCYVEQQQMKRAHILNEREIKRVFAHMSEQPFAERNRAMFQLSIYAGMRVGEIAALRWGDVFTQDGRVREQIQLTAAQTKGHTARTVLLNAQVQRELAVYGKAQGVRAIGAPLFESKAGASFSPNSLVQVMARIYKASGIDQATSHAGRHFFLTSLAEKGVSVHVLAALAGHRNISTTMVYLHANATVLRAAVELV